VDNDQNKNLELSPRIMSKFKRVNSLTSLASFPENITVYGQNEGEHILLFVRKHKIVLLFNILIQTFVLLSPFLVQYALYFLNYWVLNNSFDISGWFNSNFWLIFWLIWLSYVLKGYFNIFFQWYYDLNIMTTNRFVDVDLIGIFKNQIEETSLLNIEDVKDHQKGIIQSLFHMGYLEIFTASGQTIFNLKYVPHSTKIRDFIMDVVIEERKKYGERK
jgi:hypothetical protein